MYIREGGAETLFYLVFLHIVSSPALKFWVLAVTSEEYCMQCFGNVDDAHTYFTLVIVYMELPT